MIPSPELPLGRESRGGWVAHRRQHSGGITAKPQLAYGLLASDDGNRDRAGPHRPQEFHAHYRNIERFVESVTRQELLALRADMGFGEQRTRARLALAGESNSEG